MCTQQNLPYGRHSVNGSYWDSHSYFVLFCFFSSLFLQWREQSDDLDSLVPAPLPTLHFGFLICGTRVEEPNQCFSQITVIGELIKNMSLEAGDVGQWLNPCLTGRKPWVWSPVLYKLGMVVHACYLCIWGREAESGVPDYTWLHTEFKFTLIYKTSWVGSCLRFQRLR